MNRQSLTGSVVGMLMCLNVAPRVMHAQNSQQASPSCASLEYRQFDFWVGDWEVKSSEGRLLGTNRITRAFGGCVVHENWQSMTSSHAGSSFNIYDRASGQWHQSWVDNSGLLLQLDGGMQDDKMVLTGRVPGEDGGTVVHRISWEPISEDRVRQLWESSSDDGATWSTVFDGLYVRR